MRVAIVHERLDIMGGAERVVESLHRLYPEAPIYTSFIDYDKLPDSFRRMEIRTSYMQKLPGRVKRFNDKLLPFYMLAFQDFDFSEFDVVLSSSYVAAKSILTPTSTCHVCYCHTPMRFAWDLYPEYISGNGSAVLKAGVRLMLQYFRLWDVQTSNNVDYFIANSDMVRRRIRKHYRREAEVIHPPVNTERFHPAEKIKDYYIVVSRFVPYKRIDLAVEAFNRLGKPLIIIGTGRAEGRLKALAGPNIKFLGWQSDEAVARYLSEAQALIFPGEEDFGILPVEAQAAGCPVIAYGRGGALETVVHGKTGIFFGEQTVESLMRAVQQFEKHGFDRREINEHTRQFNEALFCEQMERYVRNCYDSFQAEQGIRYRLSLPEEDLVLSLPHHAVVPDRIERTPVK